ncbi:MAG TPA: glycosyltransferase family 4 protein, partial [Fibrobacteria bacterium]|nr:glycosyltransferase family 4 protein [Fibrobacteria bacterium]
MKSVSDGSAFPFGKGEPKPISRSNQVVNILYHHRTLGDGAEGIHIEEMIAAFRQLGHHVTVVSPVGERTNRGNQALSFGQKLKAILPRVVFEMLEVGYNLAGMIAIWKAARIRRPDFIYDRYITFNAAPVLMGRWLGVPVILEVNAPLALERSQQPDEKLILQSLAHRMERWICSNAHRALVVSTPLKDYLVSIGVPSARIEVVPNGANLSRFTGASTTGNGVREKLGIPANEVVVGFT